MIIKLSRMIKDMRRKKQYNEPIKTKHICKKEGTYGDFCKRGYQY